MLSSMTSAEALRFVLGSFSPTQVKIRQDGRILSLRDLAMARFVQIEKFFESMITMEIDEDQKPYFDGWLKLSTLSKYNRHLDLASCEEHSHSSELSIDSEDEYVEDISSSKNSTLNRPTSEWLLGEVLSENYFDMTSSMESSKQDLEIFPDWLINILIKEVIIVIIIPLCYYIMNISYIYIYI